MTTITIDEQLINEVISVSHYQNAQEAVVKILADYLRQQKTRPNIAELLAMPDAAEIDFDPPRSTMTFHPADLS
jgi:Arc/MetJ family transcription regulator